MGCGATKSYIATEQLLLSDAVDSTIRNLDFSPLANQRVFLDASYLSTVRPSTGQGLISHEYVISSVREQMLVAGCQLTTDRDSADLIAEIRLGALGTDGHSVIVGIPATNTNSDKSLLGSAPIPLLPEISFAKRESLNGAAKIAVIAYHRKTHAAVWQSGLSQSISQANDTWILGMGPMQKRDHPAQDDTAPMIPSNVFPEREKSNSVFRTSGY